MAIRTLPQLFWAFGEFRPWPLVVRVTCRPARVTVEVADTIVVPVTFETRLIVQLPVVPTVRQGFVLVNPPTPETIANVMGVPAGALTKPAPEPSFTLRC